jgi:hypothetical protein
VQGLKSRTCPECGTAFSKFTESYGMEAAAWLASAATLLGLGMGMVLAGGVVHGGEPFSTMPKYLLQVLVFGGVLGAFFAFALAPFAAMLAQGLLRAKQWVWHSRSVCVYAGAALPGFIIVGVCRAVVETRAPGFSFWAGPQPGWAGSAWFDAGASGVTFAALLAGLPLWVWLRWDGHKD